MENADGYYGAGVIARDRRDFKAALTRFTKALELRPKFWEATTHVAEIHLNGWGVPKDEPKAFSLLKALADEDNVPYGQYLVGSFYAKGIGTTRSIPDAVAYLTKSAKNGNEAAKNLLVILENRQQP